MTEYRIVTDNYSGFEVQARRWWWPFWVEVSVNTHRSAERAERYAREVARGREVKRLGTLRGSDRHPKGGDGTAPSHSEESPGSQEHRQPTDITAVSSHPGRGRE